MLGLCRVRPGAVVAALSAGPAVLRPGADGQAHAGHPALGAAPPGLLAPGPDTGRAAPGVGPGRSWRTPAAPAKQVYWRLIKEKLPLFALVVLSCLITMMAQKGSGSVMPLAIRPLGPRIANALVSYRRLCREAVLALPHGLLLSTAPGPWWQAPGRPGLAGGVGFPALRGQTPAVSGGGLALVPGHHGAGHRADPGGRPGHGGPLYLYPVHRPVRHRRLGGIRGHCRLAAPPGPLCRRGAAALLACLLATWVQVGYWRNSETLFTHAMQVTGTNYMAYHHLGMALANEGKVDQAIAMYKKTIAVAPDYPWPTTTWPSSTPNRADLTRPCTSSRRPSGSPPTISAFTATWPWPTKSKERCWKPKRCWARSAGYPGSGAAPPNRSISLMPLGAIGKT